MSGQGAITPAGFLEALAAEMVDSTRGPTNIKRYIEYANRASTQSAFEGNQTVLAYLETLGLEHLVDGQAEPERSYLLETLRVIGVRFRRLAAADEAQFTYLVRYFDEYTRPRPNDPPSKSESPRSMDEITW